MGREDSCRSGSGEGELPPTLWSEVVSAGGGSRRALESLARRYWKPVYVWVRLSGKKRQDAEDLTQEFFVSLLEKPILERANAEKGRFRTYLKACLKNFLADEFDKVRARKRGGGLQLFSLNVEGAEDDLAADLAAPPDDSFEKQWAQTVWENARLRLKSVRSDQAFQIFELSREEVSLTQADIGKKFGITAGAVAASLLQTRRVFRNVLRDEVKSTVASLADTDEELAELLRRLGRVSPDGPA